MDSSRSTCWSTTRRSIDAESSVCMLTKLTTQRFGQRRRQSPGDHRRRHEHYVRDKRYGTGQHDTRSSAGHAATK